MNLSEWQRNQDGITIREKRRNHISSEIERTTEGVNLALLEYEDSVLRWADDQSDRNWKRVETAKTVVIMYKEINEFRLIRRKLVR